jgi:hypothetical protein
VSVFCLSIVDKSNKYDGEYFSKCYEIIPRSWSDPCEVGDMRYEFRNKCRVGFQLAHPSDFVFYLRAIILKIKKFSTAGFMLKSIFFVANRSSFSNKWDWMQAEILDGKEVTFIPFFFHIFTTFSQIFYKTLLKIGLNLFLNSLLTNLT